VNAAQNVKTEAAQHLLDQDHVRGHRQVRGPGLMNNDRGHHIEKERKFLEMMTMIGVQLLKHSIVFPMKMIPTGLQKM